MKKKNVLCKQILNLGKQLQLARRWLPVPVGLHVRVCRVGHLLDQRGQDRVHPLLMFVITPTSSFALLPLFA
jgi:hypothetical protein